MKKLLLGLSLSALLFSNAGAEIYTGTSLTVGVSTFGNHARVDQYIGSTEYPLVYAKVGLSRESFDYNEGIEMAWGCTTEPCVSSDQNAKLTNDVTSVVVGIGFNLYENDGFFVDASADYYFEVDSDDLEGRTAANAFDGIDTIISHSTFSSPAIELGVGYSVDSWSFRGDINYVLNTPDVTIQHSYGNGDPTTYQNEEFDMRVYLGFGVTYWY